MENIEIVKNIAEAAGVELQENEPLSKHTGFRTGGPCAAMLFPTTEAQLTAVVAGLRSENIAFAVLGLGSNCLARDEGYDGVVLCMKKFGEKPVVDGTMIKAYAGSKLSEVSMLATENGLTGFEWAFGIPGSVGGALFMNAGAYVGEMVDVVTKVRALTPEGEIIEMSNADCEFEYRKSAFQRNGCIALYAEIQLSQSTKEEVKAAMDDFMNRRRTKQPLEYPSCGSTFRRPEGSTAAEQIDKCGLKGYRVGGAMVSEKHAGFVINYDNATSADIFAVAAHVYDVVKEKTGYELNLEVKVLGE